MTPKPAIAARQPGVGTWLLVLPPLVLLAGLIVFMLRSGPAGVLTPIGVPPVERLAITGVVLSADGLAVSVLNDGPDRVTIAQVQVDDAYWLFTAPTTSLDHLQRTTLTIPYPWVEGEPHHVRLVTSTGATFDHEIPVSFATPRPGLRTLGIFALIGLYVGVIPVAIGLLWFPLVVRLGKGGLDFVLALTVGLLAFLLVDAGAEGIETAQALPGSYQGVALLVFAAAAAYLGLEALGSRLRRRRAAVAGAHPGWVLALLLAIGIGLHNFGEGLAIGAAFALGETALGGLLIIGFALHNTTEGLAIVAPLARESAARSQPTPIGALVRLGLIGGAPTIAGAWLGGFVYSPVWALLFLGLGVGAIAQVTVQILRQTTAGIPLGQYFSTGTVVAGLLAGFVVMYTTGMLIG